MSIDQLSNERQQLINAIQQLEYRLCECRKQLLDKRNLDLSGMTARHLSDARLSLGGLDLIAEAVIII